MALQFAFSLAFYLDPGCTQMHGVNSTYGVALEASTGDGVDDIMFPAKCAAGNYKIYANSDPSRPSTLTLPEDLQLIYFANDSHLTLPFDDQCHYVKNPSIWQPPQPDNTPNSGPFYVKINSVPRYRARCTTFAPTVKVEHRTHDDDDHPVYYYDSGASVFLLVFIVFFSIALVVVFLIDPVCGGFYG